MCQTQQLTKQLKEFVKEIKEGSLSREQSLEIRGHIRELVRVNLGQYAHMRSRNEKPNVALFMRRASKRNV